MNALPYEHQAFQRLPDLADVGSKFDRLNGENIVHDVLLPLFRKYGMEHTFGATMPHKHFNLAENERLVEYKDTSVPWEAFHDNVKPNCWFFDEESIRPYEFKFGNAADIDWEDANTQQFLLALRTELERVKAKDVFGLCTYPGNNFRGRVEITCGRANINLDPQYALTGALFRTAAWFFSPELYDDSCKCLCATNRNGGHDHQGQHLTISDWGGQHLSVGN